MKYLIVFALVMGGMSTTVLRPHLSRAQVTQTGTVEQVWEDGFRLNTSEGILTVDAWDVYGDNTASHVTVGDELTITGEFDDGEFDATTITATDATPAPTATTTPTEATATEATPAPQAGPNTYTGVVERVWEDGLQLDTGDLTLTVDTWDVYGDNTASHITVGDRITITGEFDGGEFDAVTILTTP